MKQPKCLRGHQSWEDCYAAMDPEYTVCATCYYKICWLCARRMEHSTIYNPHIPGGMQWIYHGYCLGFERERRQMWDDLPTW